MFIKTDNKTKEETVISDEEMVYILEADFKKNSDVDEVLTDIVIGTYAHRTQTATYKYKA